MNQTDFFKYLGAPLINPRWSWGSIRPTDNAIFLRVWQDGVIKFNDKRYVRVTGRKTSVRDSERLGYRERLQHIDLIKNGASCFMIMCLAEDVDAIPRDIKSFNKSDLFVGGEVIELEDITHIEITNRVPAYSVRVG